MKAQTSQDFTDEASFSDEEMDVDLEAWTPQDLDPFGSFSVSRMTDLAD